MKRFAPLMILLAAGLCLVAGCGDDNGTDGGTPTPPPRLVANTSAAAPTLSSPNEAVWAGVDSLTITVGSSAVKSLATNVQLKAIATGGDLYLRIEWTDLTLDAWPNYWLVRQAGSPAIFDPRKDDSEEDQAFVLFKNPDADEYDVWNWKVLRTGGAGMGQGYYLRNDTLLSDAYGTAQLEAVVDNKRDGFAAPEYLPPDTTEFEGYKLFLTEAVHWNDSMRTDTTVIPGDPPDTEYVPVPYVAATWQANDSIPGWVIDASLPARTEQARGSRWDIFTTDLYEANGYAVVFKGKLASPYPDDMDLSAMDSVQVVIGLYDDFNLFFPAGSNQIGYTPKIWLLLP